MMLDSLADVKSRLGITTSDYDTFLSEQIKIVSYAIERYCRRRFLKATYSQTFYGYDYPCSARLELFHYPVIRVIDVVEDFSAYDLTNLIVHKPTGILLKKYGSFHSGGDTTILYEAGHVSCPAIILSVLDTLVNERYMKKSSGVDISFGSDVQRVSIPGAISIDFDYTLTNNNRDSTLGAIIGNQTNILDSFRSERAVLGSGRLEFVEQVTVP